MYNSFALRNVLCLWRSEQCRGYANMEQFGTFWAWRIGLQTRCRTYMRLYICLSLSLTTHLMSSPT